MGDSRLSLGGRSEFVLRVGLEFRDQSWCYEVVTLKVLSPWAKNSINEMMTNRLRYERSGVKSSEIWSCSESERLGFNLCVVPSLNMVSLILEIGD